MKKSDLFKLNFNPFSIDELNEDTIDLFVNRQQELAELLIFIQDFSTSAIAGEQGVGKSSFLIKLKQQLIDQNYLAQYIKLTPAKDGATLKSSFFRKILRQLLIQLSDLEIDLSSFNIDLLLESDRLDYTISFQALQGKTGATTTSIDAGKSESLWDAVIPLRIKAKLEVARSQTASTAVSRTPILHNDETMKETIHKIAHALKESGFKVVFLIDELDKLGREAYAHDHWFQEIYDLLGYCEDILTTGNLLFIFALQKEFYKKYNEALRNPDGDTHFLGLIHEIVLLENFTFKDALFLVEKRIEFAAGKRSRTDIFEPGVLEILFVFAYHNTRKFIQFINHVLTEATLLKSKKITLEILWQMLKRKHGHTWLTPAICSMLEQLVQGQLSIEPEQEIPNELKILSEKKYIQQISTKPITFALKG